MRAKEGNDPTRPTHAAHAQGGAFQTLNQTWVLIINPPPRGVTSTRLLVLMGATRMPPTREQPCYLGGQDGAGLVFCIL